MSPPMLMLSDPATSFPRVSGDEPKMSAATLFAVPFSPRERG